MATGVSAPAVVVMVAARVRGGDADIAAVLLVRGASQPLHRKAAKQVVVLVEGQAKSSSSQAEGDDREKLHRHVVAR